MVTYAAARTSRAGWWRRRVRRLRGRVPRPGGAVLAAAVAGVLVGAAGVAWQTGPPASEERACWGALTDADVAEVLDGEVRADSTPFEALEDRSLRPDGQCRLAAHSEGKEGVVTIRVHAPGGVPGRDAREWSTEFLTSDMVPLGGGRTGMASSERAWLALPADCAAGMSGEPPTIVDIDTGSMIAEREYEEPRAAADRTVLARAVTRVANTVLEQLECGGAFKVPRQLSAAAKWEPTAPSGLCGIDGLAMPSEKDERSWAERNSDGDGPVRVCTLGSLRPEISLVTVEHRGIAQMLEPEAGRAGVPVESDQGYGSLGSSRAAFCMTCQTGEVVFLVQMENYPGDGMRKARALLPRYVAAEAERLGCGKVTMRIPRTG